MLTMAEGNGAKIPILRMLLNHSKMVLLHLNLANKSYHISFNDFIADYCTQICN